MIKPAQEDILIKRRIKRYYRGTRDNDRVEREIVGTMRAS